MKKYWLFIVSLFVIFALGVSSCRNNTPNEHQDGDIEIIRYENTIFLSTPQQLPSKLAEIAPLIECELIPMRPNNPEFITGIVNFTQDPAMKEIFDSVTAHYANLAWLEHGITQAIKKLKNAYGKSDEISFDYKRFVTLTTGQFNYDNRIAVYEGSMLIAIDQYVLPYFEKFQFFGQPMYIVNMSDSSFLLRDCVSAITEQVVPFDGKNTRLLDFMVASGKSLYLLDIACPNMDDRIKMRYTPEQMKWMEDNEGNVWGYFIQNKLLFEQDPSKFNNIINDAPFTNAFRNDSAPRTSEYIGLQMVRKYAAKTGKNLQEIMAASSDEILKDSGYRPK